MFSVLTPSIAQFSKATSTDRNNYHFSNPNPQGDLKKVVISPRYKESRSVVGNRNEDILNVGKKINLGNKLTNEDILESHL